MAVLAWDAGDVQALFSHNLASIYPHNLRCNSNLFSMGGNFDPTNLLILNSAFLRDSRR